MEVDVEMFGFFSILTPEAIFRPEPVWQTITYNPPKPKPERRKRRKSR